MPKVSQPVRVAANLWIAPEPWTIDEKDWPAVLTCAKDPYHRLAVGYKGKLAATHPEYLFAYRGPDFHGVPTRLHLNMVDATLTSYFPPAVINEGLLHLAAMTPWLRTIVLCNQGCSRSAAMALMFLAHEQMLPADSLEDAEAAFLMRYPRYEPSPGIRGYMREHWVELTTERDWTKMELRRYAAEAT